MTKLGQMLVDDGYKRGKIQGALLCGKTPEEVAEMFDILLQEVLKVKENEKDMKKAFDYYNKAIEAPISTVSYYAFYNLAKYYYLTGNTVLIKDEDKAIKYLDIASSHAIEAAILLLYLYTEKYLNKKDEDLYDKIKLLISRIENNPKYNESIKSIIEDNLKKLKENKHINIDILN